MLEGREISILNNHELERTLRLDSEFYSKENLELDKRLKTLNANKLTDYTVISDGNHMSISDYFTEKGIPYYRGGDIYNTFIEQSSNPLYIPRSVFGMKTMERSHLKKGDILMSIVGAIIGNLSLVSTDNDATCSCKLAIIRPNNTFSSEYILSFLKSKMGQSQIQRFRRGSGQTGFILEDFDQLMIPIFSKQFQLKIKSLFERSILYRSKSKIMYSDIQKLLLENLKLNDWLPNKNQVNVKSLSESFLSNGRLDAEHYQVKYDELEARIKTVTHKTIAEIQQFNARGVQPDYVEGGCVSVVNSKHILEDGLDYDNLEHTTEAFFLSHKRTQISYGDILIYTTGANIGRTQVYLKNNPALASNHVNILRINGVNPIYLALVLNSLIGHMQTEKLCTGSAQAEIYPSDIEKFIVPILDETMQETIASKVYKSFELKKESKRLLDIAKEAVEIAISENEEKALQSIKENEVKYEIR